MILCIAFNDCYYALLYYSMSLKSGIIFHCILETNIWRTIHRVCVMSVECIVWD